MQGKSDAFCDEQMDEEVRINSVQLEKENVDGKFLFSLLERQGYRCALTGRKLTPKDAALDHMTPISRGGKNTRDNVQWVHKEVNRVKGNMLHEEFILLCIDVVNQMRD